jgi:hypothetical protein
MHCINKPKQSTQGRRPMCGTRIDKGAGTSSLLVTALGNSIMKWEVVAVAAAKMK